MIEVYEIVFYSLASLLVEYFSSFLSMFHGVILTVKSYY